MAGHRQTAGLGYLHGGILPAFLGARGEALRAREAAKRLAARLARALRPLDSPRVTISHYRVLEPISDRGKGVEYEAEDTRLGRRLAVRFLPAAA